MTLRCEIHQVAIYGPGVEQCRAFLADHGVDPAGARVFTDPAAVFAAIENDELRLVVAAALRGLAEASQIENVIQIVEATRILSKPPSAEMLAALQREDVEAWRSLLEPLAYRRVKARDGGRSFVLPPRAVGEAFIAADSVNGWCRKAGNVVADAIPSRWLHGQTLAHFETWLRDATEGLTSSNDPESLYRAQIAVAHDALTNGEWQKLLDTARAAQTMAEDLDVGFEARRLEASALLGLGEYAEALLTLGAVLLNEAISGRPWIPNTPARFVLGLDEREDALRHAAWLATRIEGTDDEEWVRELDRLQAALDPAAAAVLAAARNPSWAKPQSKSKSKPKPKAKPKSKSKPKAKSKSKSKSR